MENNGHPKRTSKEESKLKHEEIFKDKNNNYYFQGLSLSDMGNLDGGLYHLSKTILDKLKYRKLFLENSFKEVVLRKIKPEKLQNVKLDSDVIRWLTIYKWILRKRIPFINDFESIEGLVSKEVPFLQEWVMSINLPFNLLKNDKNKKDDINYFKALNKCKDMELLNEKYNTVFCPNYNAHIVYDSLKNFNKNGMLHEDCDDPPFEGCIYEIDRDFMEFWFKDKGTTFELWFYYVLMNYLHDGGDIRDIKLIRSMEVYYINSTLPMTEIDVLAVVSNNIIACECKNTNKISIEMILKFYGVMKILGIPHGIFACTSKYNERIISKKDVFNNYGIIIVDDLIYKPKKDIFNELDKIFKKL
jgi:hypothetical protein